MCVVVIYSLLTSNKSVLPAMETRFEGLRLKREFHRFLLLFLYSEYYSGESGGAVVQKRIRYAMNNVLNNFNSLLK